MNASFDDLHAAHLAERKTLFVTINLAAKITILCYTNHKQTIETQIGWWEMQQIHQPN